MTYCLETATGLPAKSWQALATRTGDGGEMVFGPFTADQTGGFFRVRTVQPGADPGQPELHIARNKTGGIEVRFHGEAGVLYRLETTGNVAAGNWEPLAIRTGDGRDIILGPFTTRQLAGFYRVPTVSARVRARAASSKPATCRRWGRGQVQRRSWSDLSAGADGEIPGQRVAFDREPRECRRGDRVFGPFPTSGPAGFFRVQVE